MVAPSGPHSRRHAVASAVAGLLLVATTPGQFGSDEAPDHTEQGPPPPPEVLELMGADPATDEDLALGMDQMLPYYLHRRDVEEAPLYAREAMSTGAEDDGLTVLGQTVRHAIDHLECFDAPEHVSTVRFSTQELMSICPVTEQPDLSALVIEYRPDNRCIESKSLKLYLWSFRDRRVFCEAMAAEIAEEVVRAADPHDVTVTVTQQARGGIIIEATATRRRDS